MIKKVMILFNIKEELKRVPKLPGVYIMKNELGEIIYVGKAISLKNRISQYFQSQKNHPPKVRAMVARVETFEYIITDTEVEALILEANLIKTHKPKFNILLRDDKQYPFIKINLKEKYPRVMKTRRKTKDGSRYFGPYTDGSALNDAIETIAELYPIRTCSLNLENKRLKRPCLNYHIGKCMGPCFKDVDEAEYMSMIEEIVLFLGGKNERLIAATEGKMKEAAANLEFEKAAKYRDRIESLKRIREKQKIVYSAEENKDIIAVAKGFEEACVEVFFVRSGKISGREHYMIDNTADFNKENILSSFVKQYYLTASYIPSEILIEEELAEKELISEWLSEKKGSKVSIRVPLKGDKSELLEMVKKNAFEELKKNESRIKARKPEGTEVLEQMRDCLNLRELPMRIEAYDISNTQGVNSVGSMVVFQNGKESKKDYRKFKIKYVSGPDDYSSLEEVLERRFRRGIEEVERLKSRDMEIENFSVFPDLIMMDGGKGQVNVAKKVLKRLGLDIPVCGLVKDDLHRTRGIVYENEEVSLDQNTPLFKFISRIQDEAHRFAISYHRELLNKNMIKSVLDGIPMIGETRKKNLLRAFGSVEKIKRASLEELENTQGMNKRAAEEVYRFFKKYDKGDENV